MIIDFRADPRGAFDLSRPYDFLDVDRGVWLNNLPVFYLDTDAGIYRMFVVDPATGGYVFDEEADDFASTERRARIAVSLKPEYERVAGVEVEPSIRCPRCGLISYHPEDIRNRYCVNCHQFHDAMEGPSWR